MASRDSIDDRIIDFLKADSRKSFVDIGKELHLSESAIRRRVKNMLGEGIIKRFTLEMAEDKDMTSAIVLVSVDSSTDTSRSHSALQSWRA